MHFTQQYTTYNHENSTKQRFDRITPPDVYLAPLCILSPAPRTAESMAGVKRRTKYRKQVEADVLDAFHTPEDGQEIVQIVQSHGSNILEVRGLRSSGWGVQEQATFRAETRTGHMRAPPTAGTRRRGRERQVHSTDKVQEADLGQARCVAASLG